MPAENLIQTEDIGGFIQGIKNFEKLRINAGLRYDHDSMYGSTVNPRIAAIGKLSANHTVKLIYGEAYQEPSPIQLWGGWPGRPIPALNRKKSATWTQWDYIKRISLFMICQFTVSLQ